MNILVTGGAGYVGSVLIRELLEKGYTVDCLDNLRFGGESLIEVWHNPNFFFHKCDITLYEDIDRIMEKKDFFAIVHLAAIVGDPACEKEPELAEKTNWDASVHLLEKSIKQGVSRFVFASTCSNYGKMSDSNGYVDENSSLAPISLYAQLKVMFENLLLNTVSKKDTFCPVPLRFATVYGISPRMRFDLTVNEFTKELALGKELVVFGEQFWRPYCHVADFAGAITAVLTADKEKVAYNVFNVGDTSENYTKRMIIDEIQKQIANCRIKYVEKKEDPRDYRVNFDKIKKELGFNISMRLPDGIRELNEIVGSGIIRDVDDQRYYNTPH
jgi:nucleoside-diphosphate-sugar epimerase